MCLYKATRGYILLMMLVFLQLCAWISLNAMQQTVSALKLMREQTNRIAVAQRSHNLLQQLAVEQSFLNTSCRIPVLMPMKLVKNSLPWWQENACSGSSDHLQYYYVIEFLGEDECALLTETTHANYYRMTLLMLTDTRPMYQVTFSAASDQVKSCMKQAYSVKLGIQAFREIT